MPPVSGAICEDLELCRAGSNNSGPRVLLMSGEDVRLGPHVYRLANAVARPGQESGRHAGRARTRPCMLCRAVHCAWAALAVPLLDAAAYAAGTFRRPAGPDPGVARLRARRLGCIIAAARHFRIPFYYGLLFPLGYTAAH